MQIARTAAVQVIQDVVAIAQDVEAKMQQLMQDQKQEPSRRCAATDDCADNI
jgi:hypothetical protein